MLSAAIQEKLTAWAAERDEIQNRIAGLNGEKREAAAAVQAAVEQKIVDEIIAARQNEARLDEQIQALKLVQAEIAKGHPVDHDVFQTEYAGFFVEQKEILDEKFGALIIGMSKLESLYTAYGTAYQQYKTLLSQWQSLAVQIGLDKPVELGDKTLNPEHSNLKRALTQGIRRL